MSQEDITAAGADALKEPNEQAETQEEKEKLILPRIDSASKQKTNKVGFIDEDAKSSAATGTGPGANLGAIANNNNFNPNAAPGQGLVLKESRAIITGGADNYEESLERYNEREFEEFSDNDSMDGDLKEPDVRIGESSKDAMSTQVALSKRLSKWKNYNEIFDNLTIQKKVMTAFPIVSCMITYDSTRTIVVTKEDDTAYHIRQFSLVTQELVCTERYGGTENSYIKMKDVEQDSDGTKYAIAYIDDGFFKLRVFDKQPRTEEQALEKELDVNKALGLNNHTMPIDGFGDPFIVCTFVTCDILFVNLFHNGDLKHHHFFYNSNNNKIFGQYEKHMPGLSTLNFPYKCFWNETQHEIYTFYRQGESFRIKIEENDLSKVVEIQTEKITDVDLGTMFLIKETCLVCRSSGNILFFKRIYDEKTEKWFWTQYFKLQHKGLLYFIKGNIRINITTDEKIYFYLVNNAEYTPVLENVMYNHMQCSSLIFGSRVRYGIAYKTNTRGFDIYTRKYEHDFKVNVKSENLEKSMGMSIDTMGRCLVSKIDHIAVYDTETYKELKDEQINVNLLPSTTRELNRIISFQICENEKSLAVITGKNLIKNQQKPNQLFVFERDIVDGIDKFVFKKRVVLFEIEELNHLCMQFYFQISKVQGEFSHTLLFAKKNKILQFDYMTECVRTLCDFPAPLSKQPQFFSLNDSQDCAIIAETKDAIFYNMKKKVWIDLDEKYKIKSIKQVVYDYEDQVFYIMANRFQDKLGFFVIVFHEENPDDFHFLIKLKNKLDIADANIYVLRNMQKMYKELVLSYKTIYLNTYNITILDISNPNSKNENAVFRHESFQLWESPCIGFLVDNRKEFIHLNKLGISVTSLSEIDKRVIEGNDHQAKVLHSLESINYLKIDPGNFIEFDSETGDRIIKIQQKHTVEGLSGDQETLFEQVYNVKICTPTLRELLLLQSIQRLNTQSRILEFVKLQPEPMIFYKSLLELDGANMVSILSFDSRSMECLLGDQHAAHFTDEFPLIYKTKIVKKNNPNKFFYRSAIDNALKNNQMRAIQIIIDYICKYQDNFTSSFLFLKNFGQIVDKGSLQLNEILDSHVFRMNFDYDGWISNHTNDEEYIRPFNGSIFSLRSAYRQVFHEDDLFGEIDDDKDTSKVYKINFHVNILPSLSNHYTIHHKTMQEVYHEQEFDLLSVCVELEENEIFGSESIGELIDFKWDSHAGLFQKIGLFFHTIFLICFNLYVNEIYIEGYRDNIKTWQLVLFISIIYPFGYDHIQMIHQGPVNYFQEFWNYNDISFIYTVVITLFIQRFEFIGVDDFTCKLLLCICASNSIIKTFFFMRIFKGISYLVTMIFQVVIDLMPFLFFYSILIIFMALYYAVLGLGNFNVEGPYRDSVVEAWELANKDQKLPADHHFEGLQTFIDLPDAANLMPEFQFLPKFFAYWLSCFNVSLGNFDFAPPTSGLNGSAENVLYWVLWFITLIITNVIFLNFIIAEASESYANVKETLEESKNKEKANMIAESEFMLPKSLVNKDKFPRYIIARTVLQ